MLLGRYFLSHSTLGAEVSSKPKAVAKKIEDVKVGDWVLAKDPNDSGPPKPHQVVALPRNWTDHIVHICVQGGGELQATRMHPFWVEKRGWTNAVDLKPGDRLVDEKGKPELVTDMSVEDKTTNTFNLSIEGVHTYYVLAGEIPVLVHNLNEFEVVPYGSFRNSPGDGLAGHEMLQNGWLRANGYGGPQFPQNPAMALTEPNHTPLTSAQRAAGLHDAGNLSNMSAEENISRNAAIMRNNGIPESAVQQQESQANEFAKALTKPCK